MTPEGVLQEGYSGAPGGYGVGAGGVQGQIKLGECTLILRPQYPDSIQGAVGRRRPAFRQTLQIMLVRDSSPMIRRGMDLLNPWIPRRQVASKVPHSQRVRLEGAGM